MRSNGSSDLRVGAKRFEHAECTKHTAVNRPPFSNRFDCKRDCKCDPLSVGPAEHTMHRFCTNILHTEDPIIRAMVYCGMNSAIRSRVSSGSLGRLRPVVERI